MKVEHTPTADKLFALLDDEGNTINTSDRRRELVWEMDKLVGKEVDIPITNKKSRKKSNTR